MLHSAETIFVIEYLRGFESIFETASAYEQEDSGVLFSEQNRGAKISWHCPFKIQYTAHIQSVVLRPFKRKSFLKLGYPQQESNRAFETI
jgi:hypothetical protein